MRNELMNVLSNAILTVEATIEFLQDAEANGYEEEEAQLLEESNAMLLDRLVRNYNALKNGGELK